jgi:hypothetical protein
MRALPLVLLAVLLAGCGGSGSGKPKAAPAGQLVTKVSSAKITLSGRTMHGSVKVAAGGKPGERLSLAWGLVDAITGLRASQGERTFAHITTTPDVVTKTYTFTVPRPSTPTDYIVHFALYAPNGQYLSSKDSSIFSIR